MWLQNCLGVEMNNPEAWKRLTLISFLLEREEGVSNRTDHFPMMDASPLNVSAFAALGVTARPSKFRLLYLQKETLR